MRATLRGVGFADNLITIVVADHGEHLGERRLLDHQFSLSNVLLHVPLIVNGVKDAAPAIVAEPVTLLDVAPSLLEWAGLENRSRTRYVAY